MTVARTVALVLGAALLGVIAFPASFVVRAKFFPPTFDVTSIADAPEYQDEGLLQIAWALPPASTLNGSLAFQSNGSTCGPTSVANVLQSLGEDDTEETVVENAESCHFGICLGGLTLDELAQVARRSTDREVTVLRGLDREGFRQELRRSNDASRRYIVNFHRGLLFGKGTGHHSPIGGYLEDRDLVFVLDVNADFRPWLVDADRLFDAVDAVDDASGKKRGLLRLESP